MAKTRKRVVFLITFIILIFFMVPFFVLVINSFKTTNEFITAPFSLPKEFNIENFKTAIQRMNFWSALRNTAVTEKLLQRSQIIQLPEPVLFRIPYL